mgnify:CR=1 FL=1
MKPSPYGACLVIASMLSAAPALATTCADRATVIDHLVVTLEKDEVANAMGASGSVFKVYASHAFKSWSLLVTQPEDGVTCLVASGNGVSELQEELSAL